MEIISTKGFEDYSLIDSGNGRRLERFGKYTISRPDPQALWKISKSPLEWEKADASFIQKESRGFWDNRGNVPPRWVVNYKNLSFYCRLTPFKHTGVFPEQSVNWEFINGKLMEKKGASVLNLFGYTGASTLVAANQGAKVTHVDASKPSITWARENQELSKLSDSPIRWIPDDAIKFVQREIKRGIRYDAVIMDPPVYGHGPEGEIWDFNKSFPRLLQLTRSVLSDNPLFVVVNAYAISASSLMLYNLMKDNFQDLGGKIEYGEIALEEQSQRLLSTGIFSRFSA